MRTLPAYAALSRELLWWDLLINASQCWGNRFKKSFWESLDRTLYSVKNDAMPCRQVQGLGTNYFVDDENVVGKISRVSDTTCTASAEKLRRLFPKLHARLGGMFGFARAFVQERPLNSGADSNFFGGSILADLYSKNVVTRDAIFTGQASLGDTSLAVKLFEKMQEGGVWPNKFTLLSMFRACGNGQCFERNETFCRLGQSAALYTETKSPIEATSMLESVVTETCAKHGGLDEVTDNIHKQLSLMMVAARITQKRSSYLGVLVDKLSSVTHFSWMEQVGSKSNCNIYPSISSPFDGIGLVKLGMPLNNHVISNNLEANVCFWSALADLYADCGMPRDAHNVLKCLKSSLAVPFRALIEGCAFPGECSKYMEPKRERANGSINSGMLFWSHEGDSKGLKHFMRRTNLSRSSACLKDINGFGRSMWSIDLRRAMSTSTEKQCDEDIGEQQSPSQHQSMSQQQSSLEVPESKPQGSSSWPNPDNAASYVLMSNIYADGDRWDEVKRINEMRLKARAWKKPGKAYVEIKAKVHEFIVGDRTHQDSVNIYEKLRKIKRHMGHIGYVPNVDLILENRSYYDPYKPR